MADNLKFRIELYATYWDRPPVADIHINQESMYRKEIKSTEDNPTVIEFEKEIEDKTKNTFRIDRSGKWPSQTVVNPKGVILQDQLLHIKSITIDEIDIGNLVYEAVYTPKYPEPWATQQANAGVELPKSFTNVTSMGHNGTWQLTFETPFYMWLLENLY